MSHLMTFLGIHHHVSDTHSRTIVIHVHVSTSWAWNELDTTSFFPPCSMTFMGFAIHVGNACMQDCRPRQGSGSLAQSYIDCSNRGPLFVLVTETFAFHQRLLDPIITLATSRYLRFLILRLRHPQHTQRYFSLGKHMWRGEGRDIFYPNQHVSLKTNSLRVFFLTKSISLYTRNKKLRSPSATCSAQG